MGAVMVHELQQTHSTVPKVPKCHAVLQEFLK